MAYFKLFLLTPRYKNNDIFFLQDVITEWDSPVKTYQDNIDVSYEQQLFDNTNDALYENTELPLYAAGNAADSSGIQGLNRNHEGKKSVEAHSLTYNEKLSKHRNGQKDLTFSMNQMIIRQDEWFENPFCRLITNGTQLLLEDQYNKQYIFTVSNIKFNIKENNIIYDVTCQDSFSYQLSRQNNGYTIENDSSSADFIGARTLDWWVSQKIAKECYLYNYEYIPLFKGLYIKQDGSISLPYSTLSANNVKEIVKEIYLPAEYNLDGTIKKANDQDYYETVPFSCSGSSALNALISLAEQLNMQVVVFEYLNEDFSLTRYFWFEPQKNDDRIGLIYSPNKNIQAFGLTHKGDSLTTILNVNGPEYDDELITLIPSIPSFWGTYMNSKEWRDSEYAPGMFSTICSSQSQTITFPAKTYTDSDVVNFPLSDIAAENYKQLHHVYYNKFNFWSGKSPSIAFSSNQTYSAQHTSFKLIRTVNGQEEPFNENEIIPPYVEGESWSVRVYPVEDDQSYGATIYITLYRDVTEDERNFATIADTCPWLENKLINFEYFYDNNIISKKEYEEITNKVNNELRKINGQLLWYSQAHYNAVHRQTKLIADLTNKLDLLGATFQADFVSPLEDHGAISVDINNFTNAYEDVFSGQEHNIEAKTLINLDSIKEEYVTKYFNAQQRFLKNIYNFRNYFYQNNGLYNSELYEHKLKLSNPNYGFEILKLIKIKPETSPGAHDGFNLYDEDSNSPTYGKPFVNIYQQKDNQILPVDIAYNGREMYFLYNKEISIPASVYSENNVYEYNNLNDSSDVDNGTRFTSYKDLILFFLKKYNGYINYRYYTKQPIYKELLPLEDPQIVLNPNGLGQCENQLKQSILLSSLNSFGRNLPEGTIVTKELLAEYLPVNNLYIQRPSYDVTLKRILRNPTTTSFNILNDKEDYCYWYRKTKKKESIYAYIQYLESQNNDEKDPKDLIPVENPYNNTEITYLSLDFVTPDNEALKYRLVKNYYSTPQWVDILAGILTVGCPWIQLYQLFKTIWTAGWSTSGGPDLDVKGEIPSSNETPNYATDSNWLAEHEKYKKSFAEANSLIFASSITVPTAAGQYWTTLEPYLKLSIMALSLENNEFSIDVNTTTPEDSTDFEYYTTLNKWSYNYQKASALAEALNSTIYYKCNTYNVLNKNSIVYSNHNYYLCYIYNSEDGWIFNNFTPDLFSFRSGFAEPDDVLYYPYTARFVKLNSIPSKYNGKTLQSLINDLYSDFNPEFESFQQPGQLVIDYYNVIKLTHHNDTTNSDEILRFVIYEQHTDTLGLLTATAAQKLDVEKEIYKNGQIVDFTKETNFWKNIYVIDNEQIWYPTTTITPVNPLPSDDPNYDPSFNPNTVLLYSKQNLDSRLYRVNSDLYGTPIQGYYINATEKNELLFTSTISSYAVSIYQYDLTNQTSKVIAKNLLLKPEDFTLTDATHGNYVLNNECNIAWSLSLKDKISTRTNGEFWYNYKNSDHPVLQQQALSIETQLTQYWSTAYIASKYCEYFIPEHWFSQQSSATDFFNICMSTGTSVEINSVYVPIVSLLRDTNNSTLLPRYSFKKSLLPKNSIFSKEEEFKDKINYASSSTLNNIAIRNALRNLGEDTTSWLFEENGKTSYYYIEDASQCTGYTWANFAKTYNQQFSEFSGLYIMFYKLIVDYTNQDESRYYELKQMHDNFWSQLYHDYGYLLLENVYTNENATNSLDLLKMAKLYFKDLNTPERQYNITVIDTASLDNYKGEEIRIGDGIRVNAQEFYNEYDVIYQSLSQYLFVSDISYSLRQVTDISLTVNDIKYSDKMIQRLAKLIK